MNLEAMKKKSFELPDTKCGKREKTIGKVRYIHEESKIFQHNESV